MVCKHREANFKTCFLVIGVINGKLAIALHKDDNILNKRSEVISKCRYWRFCSCRKLRIWSHLLKKFLMENFIFCAVNSQIVQCKLWRQNLCLLRRLLNFLKLFEFPWLHGNAYAYYDNSFSSSFITISSEKDSLLQLQ